MAVRKQVVSFNWNKSGRLPLKVVVLTSREKKEKEKEGERNASRQKEQGNTELSNMPRLKLGLFTYTQCSIKEHV